LAKKKVEIVWPRVQEIVEQGRIHYILVIDPNTKMEVKRLSQQLQGVLPGLLQEEQPVPDQ